MKERIQLLLTELGITATKLADEIQVQRSGISHLLSGRNQPSYDFLIRLLNRYPEIDARWLLTGEGSIFSKNIGTVKPEPLTKEPETIVRSEGKVSYGVTNVNNISRVVLLHTDGTFEVFNARISH